MRIAVLRNPFSSKNLTDKTYILPDCIAVIDLTGPENLPELMIVLRDKDIDLLIIDGGDGTVREIITHLSDTFKDEPPLIGILAHGNTNLIARNVGKISHYSILETLAQLPSAELIPEGRKVPVLKIQFSKDERPTLRGFIMGWGAYAAATDIAKQEIKVRGTRQVLRAFITILQRTLIGREAAALREGVRATVEVSDHDTIQGRRFIGIATTLPGRLIAGLNPFWGKGVGPIRWLDVHSPARLLFFAAPLAAFGRPMKWMVKAGYISDQSATMTLSVEGGIVLDGELFETDSTEIMSISASDTITFVAR